jgi:hypothetical protein
MTNPITATGTAFNLPNYAGPLFTINREKAIFLSMLGGLQPGIGMSTASPEFPTAVTQDLGAGSQPGITEDASVTAPASKVYARSQETNCIEIHQKAVTITYLKQASMGQLSGLNRAGDPMSFNEFDNQIAMNLRQIAVDINYVFLNGVYQKATSSAVAWKTRGIINAPETNVVDCATAEVTRAHLNAAMRGIFTNGQMVQPVLWCNPLQLEKMSTAFMNTNHQAQPPSRDIAGYTLRTYLTDYGELPIAFDPTIPVRTIIIADMASIAPVWMPVPGKGYLFYEELAKTGAAEKGQLYGQVGLAYGPEMNHAKIINIGAE